MKIKRVSFEHLNSILGPICLNFEEIGTGLFLITGPTGSGKSTILDAITLALYGKTCRQGAITAGSNEVMTKGTRTCFSSVVFEEGGAEYEARWSQRKAKPGKGKQEGKLYAPERSLSKNGESVAESSKEVGDKIVQILGMGFDQFTQAVLLAQGGFNKFLAADAKDKGAMLTQLTKVDIYQQIGKAVYQKYRDLEGQLDLLKNQQEQDQSLLSSDPQALVDEMKALDEKAQTLEAEAVRDETMQKAWDAYEEAQRLQAEITRLQEEIETLTEEGQALQEASRRSKEIAPFLAQRAELKSSQDFLARDSSDLEHLREELLQKERLAMQAAKQLQDAAAFHEKGMANVQAKEARLEQARTCQAQLAPLKHNLEDACAQLAQKQQEIKTEHDRLQSLLQNREHIDTEIHKRASYLTEHQDDSRLSTLLSQLEDRKEALSQQQEIADAAQKNLDKLQTQLRQNEAQLATETEAMQTIQEKQWRQEQRQKELCTRKETQYRNQSSETLRMQRDAFMQANMQARLILDMETQRTHLADGKPCPLCGSLTHPYTTQKPHPTINEEAIAVLDIQIPELQEIEQELRDLELKLQGNRQELARIQAERDSLSEAHARLAIEAETAAKDVQAKTDKLSDINRSYRIALAPYGEETWDDRTKERLEQRAKRWAEETRNQDIAKEKLRMVDDQIEEQKHKVEGLSSSELQAKVDAARKEVSEKETQIRTLLGDEDMETYQQDIAHEQQTLQAQLDAARKRQSDTQGAVDKQKHMISVLEARRKETEAQAQAKLQNLLDAIKPLMIDNLDQFDARILSPKQLAQAEEEAEQLRALRQTLKEDLARVPQPPLERPATEKAQLLAQIEAHKQQAKEVAEAKGKIAERLDHEGRIRTRIQEREARQKQLEEAYHQWKMLNDLIGDAEGNKFQKFAQNISFKVLVDYANRQMEKLNNRYLLCAKDEEPLTVYVYDAAQGRERIASNLSGGESFLVSLALALALASFSPGRSSIESLFLDEGFGTLDQMSLKMVLSALRVLQGEDHKQIGVISHIDLLQTELDNQIVVSKDETGHSKLTGCGVHYLPSEA